MCVNLVHFFRALPPNYCYIEKEKGYALYILAHHLNRRAVRGTNKCLFIHHTNASHRIASHRILHILILSIWHFVVTSINLATGGALGQGRSFILYTFARGGRHYVHKVSFLRVQGSYFPILRADLSSVPFSFSYSKSGLSSCIVLSSSFC